MQIGDTRFLIKSVSEDTVFFYGFAKYEEDAIPKELTSDFAKMLTSLGVSYPCFKLFNSTTKIFAFECYHLSVEDAQNLMKSKTFIKVEIEKDREDSQYIVRCHD